MADNVVANAGAGGATFATDDIGGVHYPITKVAFGALDTATLVTTSAGLPVQVQGTFTVDTELPAAAALGDGTANPTAPAVGSFPHVWDGSDWSRLREIVNGLDSAGTGILAAGLAGHFDDASTGAVTENQFAPVRISSRRALLVEGVASGTAVTVSGTVTANAGTGTLAVSNTTLSVTGGGTEAAALRVTIANDSTGVVSVDDNGGALTVDNGGTFAVQESGGALTALQLIDNIVSVVDGAAGSTPTGVAALAVRDDSLSTLTPVEGDFVELRTSSTGALWVVTASTVTVAGTVTANAGSGTFTVANGGTFAVQESGSALTALQLLDDAVFTDDAAFTPGTSKGLAVGLQADETSPDSVNEGDFGVPRMTLERFAIVTTKPVATGEGCDVFRSIDLDETEEDVKTSAGQLYGYYFANLHASSWRYLKFYNDTAANVVVGTTTPFLTIPLPATSAGHIMFSHPVKFSVALSAAATTGVADNDTGAPGANEVVLNAWYK